MDEPIQHDEMAAQMLLQFNQPKITVGEREKEWKGAFAKANLETCRNRAAEAKAEALEMELAKENERREAAEKGLHLFRLRIKKLWEDLQRREVK